MTGRVERRSVAWIREATYTRPIYHQFAILSALEGMPANRKMWVSTCSACPVLAFHSDWRKTVYGAIRHHHVNHRG